MRTRALAAALLAALAAPTLAQPLSARTPGPAGSAQSRRPHHQPTILRKLAEKAPEAAIEELPLSQTFEWLGDQVGVNLVVRWQALEDIGVPRDKPITLHVKNLTLSKLLWLLLSEAGGPDVKLAYRASDDLILVSTAEDLDREMVVRVYPISDLLTRIPRFQGPHISLGGQSGSGGSGSGVIFDKGDFAGGDEGSETARPDPAAGDPLAGQLIAAIVEAIEPDSWSVGGGHGTIRAFGSVLIVRNTLKVHQQLGGPVIFPD